MNTKEAKREWRRKILALRAELTEAERADRSRRATQNILSLPALAACKRIMLFYSFQDEIDTRWLLAEVQNRGQQVWLPQTDVAARKLTPYVYRGEDELRPGVYGIMEPDPAKSVQADLSQLDAVVVPGVAFDRAGGRLGYGGGFYDRFLAALQRRPLLIGFAFSLQVVEQVPREEHDFPLDYLVTDEAVCGPFF